MNPIAQGQSTKSQRRKKLQRRSRQLLRLPILQKKFFSMP
ncbi:hypothetical protein [Halobacteriovorax marinus]